MRSMRGGKVTVVDRGNGSAFDFLDVSTGADPIGAERRETALDIAVEIGVAPGTAGVVDADWFVDFDFAGHGFRRGEGDFAERNAEIEMEFAGDENLAGIGKLIAHKQRKESGSQEAKKR